MKHTDDPLHGATLKMIVEYLVDRYGWDDLGERIKIKCFQNDPSVNSSLTFLRKTPWAREKVETLYARSIDPDYQIPSKKTYGDLKL
jgi:uncharacterized protein (DUF2132 family)